jgi:small ligand-binding sensory domain FIST
MSARSFLTASLEEGSLARVLVDVRRAVGAPTAGVVFASGMPARQALAVARVVREAWKGMPAVIVPAAGVLHERGEIERTSAVSGLVWRGGRAEAFAVPPAPAELGPALGPSIRAASGPSPAGARTVLLFARPEAMQLQSLDGLAAYAPEACLVGAGAVGGDPVAITAGGDVLAARAAGLVLSGLAAPIVEASPAVRLLSPFVRIDEARDGLVVRLGGRPALEVLSAAASGLRAAMGGAGPQPIVFAAVADDVGDVDEGRFAVRNVRGVDPARQGVLIGPDAREGARFAFAVLDAAAARADLERVARKASEAARGSAPRFALYLSCAGRGQGLYGASEVEARLLRQRFGDLPIAGMHSAFEIVSWGKGRAKMQFFTGVLALFRSPS